jgi:hypothetical protein
MTIVLNAVTHGMAAASETKSGEFAPSARFPKAIWCQQLSPDSGSGARPGAFESQVASAGLEAGYLFSFSGYQASLSARIYREVRRGSPAGRYRRLPCFGNSALGTSGGGGDDRRRRVKVGVKSPAPLPDRSRQTKASRK